MYLSIDLLVYKYLFTHLLTYLPIYMHACIHTYTHIQLYLLHTYNTHPHTYTLYIHIPLHPCKHHPHQIVYISKALHAHHDNIFVNVIILGRSSQWDVNPVPTSSYVTVIPWRPNLNLLINYVKTDESTPVISSCWTTGFIAVYYDNKFALYKQIWVDTV